MRMFLPIMGLYLTGLTLFNYGLTKYEKGGFGGSNIPYNDYSGKLIEYIYGDYLYKSEFNKLWYLYSSVMQGPKKGKVENSEQALRIAESTWIYLYGFEALREKPYSLGLVNNNVWKVNGHFPQKVIYRNEFSNDTFITCGLPHYIEIRKHDGKILKLKWQ